MEFAGKELKLSWAVLSHELNQIVPPLSISSLKSYYLVHGFRGVSPGSLGSTCLGERCGTGHGQLRASSLTRGTEGRGKDDAADSPGIVPQ